MTISEPMTMLTDYLLAAVVAVLALRLYAEGHATGQRAMRWWAGAFLATALAAAVGGTFHGFALILDAATIRELRRVTFLAIGIAAFLMLQGSIVASVGGHARRPLLWANVLKLVVDILWLWSQNDFGVAAYNYVASMLAILLLEVRMAVSSFGPRSRWVLLGLGVSFGAAGLQQAELGLHRHFNHNDLYHVIQMAAFWALYRGGRLLRDK